MQAIAIASPIAKATVVLAVGARFKGQDSLSIFATLVHLPIDEKPLKKLTYSNN